LKFGIHIMRGIPRQAVHGGSGIMGTEAKARDAAQPNSICPWNTDMYGLNPKNPASQSYYNSLFSLYASWGVDFVKVDDIAASRLYGPHLGEIAMIRKAIEACGGEIVLSLSPGPASLEQAWRYRQSANMWRITDDFWDRWELLLDMFDRCERWYAHVGEGRWPDCDMLPLGRIGIRSVDGGGADRKTRFTRDEQISMMSLWSIFRSPLMMGGNLPDCDEWTESLLTNGEVLAVQRESSGNRPILREGPLVVWAAEGGAGAGEAGRERYLALFNTGEEPIKAPLYPRMLSFGGMEVDPGSSVRDLWAREALGPARAIPSLEIAPHGARMLRIGPEEADKKR
jgi:alpha-galactosidase